MTELSRPVYADLYGPTTGDRIRLADTDLLVEIEEDRSGGPGRAGGEAVFGGGKVIRESMGQPRTTRAEGAPDTVITGAVIIDHWGIVKADIGIRDGRIRALGTAGNPDVRAGARLTVDAAAATVALPGRGGGAAHYDVRLTVAADATLRWLPEPLVSAAGSLLFLRTRAELAEGARLMLREELVLGRHGESPGTVTSRLSARYAGVALLDQETSFGPGAPEGWDGGAVLGEHRAIGQLLCVEPAFGQHPVPVRQLGGTAVIVPLAGPAALATAVADDGLRLRRALDSADAALRGLRAGR